jgi:uncharacterized damage-inducible protein DinB
MGGPPMTHSKSLIQNQEGWKWSINPSISACLQPLVSNLDQCRLLIYQSVEDLPAELVWKRISPATLSIGNILMHVSGSEHQWIGNKLGGNPLERDRDLEMSATSGKDVTELLHAWRIVQAQSMDVLSRFTESDQDRLFTEDRLTIPFVLHYCAQHLAFHAGQLVLLRKWLEPSFKLYKDNV